MDDNELLAGVLRRLVTGAHIWGYAHIDDFGEASLTIDTTETITADERAALVRADPRLTDV